MASSLNRKTWLRYPLATPEVLKVHIGAPEVKSEDNTRQISKSFLLLSDGLKVNTNN